MSSRRSRLAVVGCAALAVGILRGVAYAQWPDQPYSIVHGRATFAGEVSAIASLPDDEAYFNYTDYEHNSLRTFRARIFGQWRLAPGMAVLGELRTENADQVALAAMYARWRPWEAREFDVQVGRIPPVIGSFGRRAYGRENTVISTPLVYQYLIALRPDALPANVDDVLRMRGRGWQPFYPIGSHEPATGIPLVSAAHWDTGAEVHWHHEAIDLAGALTRGAPAVPIVRKINDGLAISGRAAVTPIPGLTLGASLARGSWIERSVLAVVPPGTGRDSAQQLVGVDGEFGVGRVLLRGEWLRTGFDVPLATAPAGVQRLDASGAFLEGRYRFTPRWQIAARADRLGFSEVTGAQLGTRTWDAPVKRIETVIGYRATRNLEVRAGWQRDWRDGGRVRRRDYPAAQILYWF